MDAAEQARKSELAKHLFGQNRLQILDGLDIKPVLCDLRQADVLSEDDEERIMSGITMRDKISNLMNRLYRLKLHPTALQEFLTSIERHQHWLYDTVISTTTSRPSLQQRVRDCYARKKALSMKHPWATERSSSLPNELYTNLKLINYDEATHQRKDFEQYSDFQNYCRNALPNITLKELFDYKDEGTRVLLEGDAGVGKTTLCYKLAHDFAQPEVQEDQKYFVHELLFVFLFEIRNFRGSLKETLQRSLSLKDVEINELWTQIQFRPNECLFVLDGLDESTRDLPREIIDLIEGRLLGRCLVLATCRSNKVNNLSSFFHKNVINVGFIQGQEFEYVKKYFSHTKVGGAPINIGKIVQILEDESDILGDLLRTPLNCLLLCLWLEDWIVMNNGEGPFLQGKRMTATNLYEMVIRSVLKRYCQKNDIPLTRGRLPTNMMTTLVKFYKLALFGILKEKYMFTIGDLANFDISENDAILNIGFLTREYSVSTFSEEDSVGYSFPHRCIQDFFAASAFEYLSDPLKGTLVAFFGYHWRKHDLFCLFLSGLLRDSCLLKWLICCTLESRSDRDENESPPSSLAMGPSERNANAEFMNTAFKKADVLLDQMSHVIDGIDHAKFLEPSQINDFVAHYESAKSLWRLGRSGKLDEEIIYCLRMLYEISHEESLTMLINFLYHLSQGEGPIWEQLNDHNPEIRTIIVRLWLSNQEFCERSIFSKDRFYLHCSQIRDNGWEFLFNQAGLSIRDLELSYYHSARLVDILRNLGPQKKNIEKLQLNCDRGNQWREEQRRLLESREKEERDKVRENISEMTQIKYLSISGRDLDSCIGLLPEKMNIDKVTVMALNWPERETEELVQEVLSCQVEKLTLVQRCHTSSHYYANTLQTLQNLISGNSCKLKDVSVQGFKVEKSEIDCLLRLREFLKSKQINLRFINCKLSLESGGLVDFE